MHNERDLTIQNHKRARPKISIKIAICGVESHMLQIIYNDLTISQSVIHTSLSILQTCPL